jgi:hypothetical protein
VANRVFYRIDPKLPVWARRAIDAVAQGLVVTPEYATARRRLHEFPNRPEQRADFAGEPAVSDAHGGKEIHHAV